MSDNKKNMASRFAGKGYYIALVLCAAAIGISGYLYYHNANPQDPSLQNPDSTVDVLNPDATGGQLTLPSLTQPNPTVPAPTKKPFRTGKPVSGQVVVDYAVDCLCYNPTTRDWRTHSGMDFAAESGTEVVAAADGTVYTVYEDEKMGTTVVICHEDGYVTTYCSLDPNVAVSVGDTVALGDVIGYVGSTALMECALGNHVHFSVTCDGESVDPEVFFGLN